MFAGNPCSVFCVESKSKSCCRGSRTRTSEIVEGQAVNDLISADSQEDREMILRHPRGRGCLQDDAEANRGTCIDKTSTASGFSKLRDCKLYNSHAQDEVQIYGGIYRGSIIKGKTICAGSPLVVDSILDCSEVSGRPTIYNSGLFGMTEVCDDPVINGIVAEDAIIYGSPSLLGTFKVTGRVHEGTWTRAPKHIKLQWCDLSECVDGKVLLDCRCRTVDYWLRHGAKLAKRWEWSDDQISVTLDTVRREFVIA